jgi:pyruvate/2-oxoglutarate dehydrogenase complex dihydrolipoamide dehydrogenase (E3) component
VKEAVICEVDDKWQPIPGTEKILEVDTIAIAAGLKPLAELAFMHDCKTKFDPILGGWAPVHDENMESTSPGIYVVGDVTGVEEANTALEEGRLAGVAIAESLGKISSAEASEEKAKIWERLDGLRAGPHGVARKKAKERQLKSFTELAAI